jgi:hypothetical protein
VAAIGVDFDGVVHAYSQGWRDGSIYDEPLPGALESIAGLMDTYSVFIFTARTELEAAWIEQRSGLRCLVDDGQVGFWTDRTRLLVTNRKVAAVAYVDDRAIRFTSWGQALAELARHLDCYQASTGTGVFALEPPGGACEPAA